MLGEQQAAAKHRLAGRDELRQERQIENRDLRVQNVREKTLKERSESRAVRRLADATGAGRPASRIDWIPIHTRYPAPSVFTTLNAVADVARIADSPSADAVA